MASQSNVSRTLVENHRWLLRVFGGLRLSAVLVFAVIVAVVLVAVGGADVSIWRGSWLAAAGVVYWTFVEYAVHRWFYHWTPGHRGLRRVVESFHVYHHRNMEDRAVWNAGPALVLLFMLVLSAPPLAVFGGIAPVALFMAGAVAAYALYEIVHHQCHARLHRRGPMAYLQAFHLRHHDRNWRRNFGVSNPFWDWALGTLDRSRER